MTLLPEAKLYIDGVMRPAAGNKTYDNIGPWTGDVVGKAADASAADVDAAIAAARRAFDTTDWSQRHEYRFELMKKYRDLLYANRERLVQIARLEAGSAIGAAARAQIDGALSGADGLLECFPLVKWEEDRGVRNAYGFDTRRIVTHEAMGVVGAITPWNVPLYVNVGKVVAALLAGCTVILKPAPDTPLMGSIMGELAIEAGLPPGVFNVTTSADPAMAGEMLTKDPRVDLISFTGSTAVGKRIMENGASTLKRVFLELGGKSAFIVLDDAPNFAQTVMGSMVVFHAGQGCAYPTRLLVPKSKYAEAVKALEMAYAGFASKWGHFDEPTCIMGPLISRRQLERVKGYVELGKQEGARLLAGGNVRTDKGGGFFIEPTCFVDVRNDMRIAQEEIFGPVLVVIPFEDDEDAIRIANDSVYGLGGAVFGSTERALGVVKRIRAGALSVNGGMSITGDLPFGGYKQSGMGREWGLEGIEEFLETKAIGIRVS
ncbi:MAG TPA: aldehyde dehydrogenase family protein [Povalibacter sp.]|uniref:aldehyde dehydrogenase family protein n=1 Tax=Povalibacter sp. TaxID=1962978 RepID=UPI002C6BB06C|nr:aldehyde dehydrogenase family protein [Povalibacter sp.]HMN46845.1 aldehyde dehydrogenase family protein [Povalibacter sp.]